MQIEDLPEGVIVEAIRYPKDGDVVFGGQSPLHGPVMNRVEGDVTGRCPTAILKPDEGYEFVKAGFGNVFPYESIIATRKFQPYKYVTVRCAVATAESESELRRLFERLPHGFGVSVIEIESAAVSVNTGEYA